MKEGRWNFRCLFERRGKEADRVGRMGLNDGKKKDYTSRMNDWGESVAGSKLGELAGMKAGALCHRDRNDDYGKRTDERCK